MKPKLLVVLLGIVMLGGGGYLLLWSKSSLRVPRMNPSIMTRAIDKYWWAPLSSARDYGFSYSGGSIPYSITTVEGENVRFTRANVDVASMQFAMYSAATTTGFANFAKDQNNVYYYDSISDIPLRLIPGADPLSFIPVKSDCSGRRECGYGKDKNRAYWQTAAIPNSDPESFQTINDSIASAKDKDHVYVDHVVALPNADPDTFADIRDPQTGRSTLYARDKAQVYYGKGGFVDLNVSILPGADPATFEVLGNHYSRDAHHVYADAQLIPDADAATFKVLKDGQKKCGQDYCNAEDQYHSYLGLGLSVDQK